MHTKVSALAHRSVCNSGCTREQETTPLVRLILKLQTPSAWWFNTDGAKNVERGASERGLDLRHRQVRDPLLLSLGHRHRRCSGRPQGVLDDKAHRPQCLPCCVVRPAVHSVTVFVRARLARFAKAEDVAPSTRTIFFA